MPHFFSYPGFCSVTHFKHCDWRICQVFGASLVLDDNIVGNLRFSSRINSNAHKIELRTYSVSEVVTAHEPYGGGEDRSLISVNI